jgi:hypothetical protein
MWHLTNKTSRIFRNREYWTTRALPRNRTPSQADRAPEAEVVEAPAAKALYRRQPTMYRHRLRVAGMARR